RGARGAVSAARTCVRRCGRSWRSEAPSMRGRCGNPEVGARVTRVSRRLGTRPAELVSSGLDVVPSSRTPSQVVQERVELRQRSRVAVRLLEGLPRVPRLLLSQLRIVPQPADGRRETRVV